MKIKVSYKTVAIVILTTVSILGLEHGVYKPYIDPDPDINTCFVPSQIRQECTNKIVTLINSAQREVLVQAYGFTSEPILDALVRAHERNVHVRIILDKTNVDDERYHAAEDMQRAGIEVFIDDKVAIAHNKVIIVDGRHVVSGSFNFTNSAQTRNAENAPFFMNAPRIAARYRENWQSRLRVSRPL